LVIPTNPSYIPARPSPLNPRDGAHSVSPHEAPAAIDDLLSLQHNPHPSGPLTTRQTPLMGYMTECEQSRLLRDLGALVNQRKARIAPGSLRAGSPSLPPDARSAAEGFFEFELRCLFSWLSNFLEFSRELSNDEFQESDLRSKALCDLLERLVDPRLPLTTEREPPGDYPRLLALVGLLQDSTRTYHLASRSNPSLFQAPDDENESDRALDLLTKHNAFLNRFLLPSTRETAARPAKSGLERAKKSWRDSELRHRATATLRALANHLGCRRSHEIMLKLSEESHRTISPELNLMLSACRDQCEWLDVQCGSIESYVRSPSSHVVLTC